MNRDIWRSFSLIGLATAIVISAFAVPLSTAADPEPFPKNRMSFVGQITQDEEGRDIIYPSHVWVDSAKKEIYVIEGHGQILIYNERFFPLFVLGKEHGIESSQGLMVDAGGYLWVAQAPTPDNKRGRISVYDRRLNWKKDIYFSGFKGSDTFVPYRLAENSRGQVFVIGSYNPAVVVLDSFGNFEEVFFQESKLEGTKKQVALNDIMVGPDDRLYLLSEETSHVYVYDADRHFLYEFGQKGGSTGKMSRPQGMVLDRRTGNYLIVDYMRHAVTVYNNKGEFAFEFGGLGWGEGWFQYPKDIAIDQNGRIFVADTFNNRVQVFQLFEKALPEQAAKDATLGEGLKVRDSAEAKPSAGEGVPVEGVGGESKQRSSIPPIPLDNKRTDTPKP